MLKNNMANDSECFLGPGSRSIAQRHVVKEVILRRECPPPTALITTPPAEIQEYITVKPRAYQLEMLEESLKRNVIVAVCFSHSLLRRSTDNPQTRWTLVAAKHMCKLQSLPSEILSPLVHLDLIIFASIELSFVLKRRSKLYQLIRLVPVNKNDN